MLRSLASRLRRLSSKGNSKNLGWRQVISLLVYYTACFWHPSLFRLQSENGGHRWCWLQCHCWRYKAIRGIQHANTICMALTWWTKSLISWLSRLSDHSEWIPFVSCVFYHCTSCDNLQISLVYICPPNVATTQALSLGALKEESQLGCEGHRRHSVAGTSPFLGGQAFKGQLAQPLSEGWMAHSKLQIENLILMEAWIV